MLRILDVEMSTPLPIVAEALRIARNWVKHDPNYEFSAGGRTWASAIQRRNGSREPAKGRRLGDLLATSRTFEFIHNPGPYRTAATVTTDAILTGDRPETGYPKMHDMVGTLAIEDLTYDDGHHGLFRRTESPDEKMREHAMRLLCDERQRAREEHVNIDSGLQAIRARRHGPLVRHGASANHQRNDPDADERLMSWINETAAPEAQTDTKLRLGDDDPKPKPKVTVRNGTAHFAEFPNTGVDADDKQIQCNSDEEIDRAIFERARDEPGNMAATEFYGQELNNRHRHQDAITVLQHTVNVGLDALPAGFDGPIEDENSDQGNAFLKAASTLADLKCLYGSRKQGIELYERVIQWKPETDSYARARLGSEYVAAGRIGEAIEYLTKHRFHHPPNSYDLALCHIINTNWATAAVAVQQGLAMNPYVGEILMGNRSPMAAPNGNRGHWGRALSTARGYVLRYNHVWNAVKDAKPFLRWMATHPKAVTMLAEIRKIDYEAAFTRDDRRVPELATDFVGEVELLTDRWTEMPSETLVRKPMTHRPPWTILAEQEEPDGS